MVEPENPQAKQIINLVNNQIVIDLETLKKILMRDEIKDKHVCVVAITGTCRQGKSFLLNFLIRYLNITYKEKKNVENWLDVKDGPLRKYFSFKGGSAPHTTGIYMYSEIFLAKSGSADEVAVILLDTQGTFDNKTGIGNCGKIFALSTLISSLQIYNLKNGIKQFDLQHLQYFSGFGNMLLDESNLNDAPFQDLLFLVRDWASKYQHALGAEGGMELLEEELNTETEQDESLIPLKENIKRLFKNVSCYLMPSPGYKVIEEENFDGKLEDIRAEFKQQMEILARLVLKPENLRVKTLNSEKITASDLFRLLTSYCQQFKDKDMPQLQSLFEATADVHYKTGVEKAVRVYTNSMSCIKDVKTKALQEHLLVEKHADAKTAATEFFLQRKKMGSGITDGKHGTDLSEIIEAKFVEYRDFNTVKLKAEKKQEEKKKAAAEIFYKEIVDKSVSLYISSMNSSEGDSDKSIKKSLLQKEHEAARSAALTYFERENHLNWPDIIEKCKSDLEKKLEAQFLHYEKLNDLKLRAKEEQRTKELVIAEIHYATAWEASVLLYEKLMISVKDEGAKALDDPELLKKTDFAKSEAIKLFALEKQATSAELYKEYKAKLLQKLDKKCLEDKKHNLQKLEAEFEKQKTEETSAELHYKSAVEQSFNTYVNSMSFVKDRSSRALDQDKLQELHSNNKHEAINQFKNLKRLDQHDMIFEKHIKELDMKLEEKFLYFQKLNFTKLKLQQLVKKAAAKNHYELAFKKAISVYEKMSKSTKNEISLAKTTAINHFQKQQNCNSVQLFNEFKNKLMKVASHLINRASEHERLILLKRNCEEQLKKNKKLQAEKHYDSVLNACREIYNTQMEEACSEGLEDSALFQRHVLIKSEARKHLKKLQKNEKIIYRQFFQKLDVILEDDFLKYKGMNAAKLLAEQKRKEREDAEKQAEEEDSKRAEAYLRRQLLLIEEQLKQKERQPLDRNQDLKKKMKIEKQMDLENHNQFQKLKTISETLNLAESAVSWISSRSQQET